MFYLMHLVIQVWDKGNKIKRTVSFPLALYLSNFVDYIHGDFRDKCLFYKLTGIKDRGDLMNSAPVLASLLPLTVYVMFVPSSQLSACLPGMCFSASRPSPHRQRSPSLSWSSQAAALTHTLPFRSREVRVLAGERGGALPARPPWGCACGQELPVVAELPSGIYTFSSQRGTGTLGNKSK